MKFVLLRNFVMQCVIFFVPMENLEFWLYNAVNFLGGCHLKFSKKMTTCEDQSKIFFFQKLHEKKLCEGIRGLNLSFNSKFRRWRQLVSPQKKSQKWGEILKEWVITVKPLKLRV